MFKVKDIDLGDVLEGKELVVEFPYEDIKRVYKMVLFCDCTKINNYRKDQKIVIKYTPKEIPTHLSQVSIVKKATIYYNPESAPYEEAEQTLTFVATVVKEIKEKENGSL